MRILNIIIISFFVLLSTIAQAEIPERSIACPSIDMIHKIAPLLNKVYTTAYSTYQVEVSYDRNTVLPWFIMSYNIAANSKDEAIEVAQKRCGNVSHMVYQNARKGGLRNDEYSCFYYDGTLSNPFVSIIAISTNNY